MKSKIKEISNLLPSGYDNRISAKSLQKLTGLNARNLTDEIRRERLEGKMIMATKADGGGYYLAETPEEMKEFCSRLKKESDSMLEVVATVQAKIKVLEKDGKTEV